MVQSVERVRWHHHERCSLKIWKLLTGSDGM